MGPKPVNGRALPIFFVMAAVIPTGFGLYRTVEIIRAGDFALHFVADHVDRLPLLFHVIGSIGFLLLAMLQILPGFRYRHPLWHRRSGRWTAPLGILGGLSGIWMTLARPQISDALLYWGRLAAASAWIIFLCLGLRAVRLRNYSAHGRWMIRAFGLILPAGTLAFLFLPLMAIIGQEAAEAYNSVMQVGAWIFHLAAAEYLIRRRMRRSAVSSVERAFAPRAIAAP